MGEALPLSVWTCAQQPARGQREGRYVPESTAHPAKMLPAIAARAVEVFTRPGELVLDPMCGIGTSLVEAVYLGRNALGVEYESRWAQVARANLERARAHGATASGQVITGDARELPALTGDPSLAGKAALLVTSPPYGNSLHGQVRPTRDSGRPGIDKWDNRYSRDRVNLAHRPIEVLLEGFTEILAGCLPLMRPGGIALVTTRSFRRHGKLIDFPQLVWRAAQDAGFEPFQRLVALLCAVREGHLVARASFWQIYEVRRQRKNGDPLHLIAHEDVLVLRAPNAVSRLAA